MDDLNAQFHVAVLTVPDIVTPEQFPSWFRREALAIQESCAGNSFAIVRLFLPSRVRATYSAKKLDALMQSITEKYKNIHLVELIIVDEALNNDEMKIIQSDAEQELANLLESIAQFQQHKNDRSRLH